MNLLSRLFGSRPLPGRLNDTNGFLDIDLPLTSTKVVREATHIECRGIIDGSVVAFAVRLDPDWKAQQLQDSTAAVHWGTGALVARGAESKNFVSLLSLRCGYNSISERSMLASVPFQVVCLEGNPQPQPTRDVRTKLFFHAESEHRYAEVFLNLDGQAGVVQFHEKDNGYRLPLLRALTEA